MLFKSLLYAQNLVEEYGCVDDFLLGDDAEFLGSPGQCYFGNTLQQLEAPRLINPIKAATFTSKTKKLYISYDLTPPRKSPADPGTILQVRV